MKKNIVLFDNDEREHQEYMRGIASGSSYKWEAGVCIANGQQKTIVDKLIRYLKYFVYPFAIFLKRKQYNVIVGWQSFYAINFAFYCHLFHAKKVNRVVIQHLIYRPKKGIIGKIYEKYMRFAVCNEYVDIAQTEAENYVEYLHNVLNIPKEKIIHVPFGVNDFTRWEESNRSIEETDYILAIGRSNRDWSYVIRAIENTDYQLVIICDSESLDDSADNVTVLKLNGVDTLPYFKNCLSSIIAVEDGTASSGDTVFCQCLCYGKPTIVIKPCSLTKNYLIDGYNGFAVTRNREEILAALSYLKDETNYQEIQKNCRLDYEEKYSLYVHAEKIGQMIKRFDKEKW